MLDDKINLFIGLGTSHMMSGPTGYVHLQELFYSLNGTVIQPFKGVSILRSIHFVAPMMVRTELTGGVSVKDILDKLRLEAFNAGRTLVVWNTNDTTITNRSHTNNVAIETYVPIKFEQEIRESTFYEILLTLYRSQNHKLMRPLVSLKLATKEGITTSSYRSRNRINSSPRSPKLHQRKLLVRPLWEGGDAFSHF